MQISHGNAFSICSLKLPDIFYLNLYNSRTRIVCYNTQKTELAGMASEYPQTTSYFAR